MSSEKREEREAILDEEGDVYETPEEIELDERQAVHEEEIWESTGDSDTENDSDPSGTDRLSSENADELDSPCLCKETSGNDEGKASVSSSNNKRKLRSKKASSQENSDDNDSWDNSDSDEEPELLQSTDSDSDNGPTTDEPKTLEHLGIALNKSERIWNSHKSLHSRELGFSTPYLFTRNVTGSLNMIQKFKLERKLEYHTGCVNTLNFNETGDVLVSGSDDLNLVLWDWTRGKKKFHYESGHTGNVFQVIQLFNRVLNAPHGLCLLLKPYSMLKMDISKAFSCFGVLLKASAQHM
jgi:WD repeat-containing protein 42A